MTTTSRPWYIVRALSILIPLAFVSFTAVPLSAQGYVPGLGMVEEDEWYDPSDWFDGNDLETEDIYGNYGEYEYNYDEDTNQYVIDERDDDYDDDYYGGSYDYNSYYGGYDDDVYYDYDYDYYDNLYTDDWYEDRGVYDTWYDE